EVLKEQYKKGSYEEALEAYKQHVSSLKPGSNRTPGTGRYVARKTFDKVNAAFQEKVTLPADAQIHHALEGGRLADDPVNALDASHLEIVTGKEAVKGTTHNRAARAVALQKQGDKNPGRTATVEMEDAKAISQGATDANIEPAESALENPLVATA